MTEVALGKSGFHARKIQSEVDQWDRIWSRDTLLGAYAHRETRELKALDKIAHYIKRAISFEENESVLEAGCGDGQVIIQLAKLFKVRGWGLDWSQEAIEKLNRLLRTEEVNVRGLHGNVIQIPTQNCSFDKVISLGVIEHLEHPAQAVQEFYRVLKPNGLLILMTPNSRSVGRAERIFKTVFGQWHFGRQIELSPQELQKMAFEAGFRVVRAESVLRDAQPGDCLGLKLVSKWDRLFNWFFPSWGFYSYVYAKK